MLISYCSISGGSSNSVDETLKAKSSNKTESLQSLLSRSRVGIEQLRKVGLKGITKVSRYKRPKQQMEACECKKNSCFKKLSQK